MVVSTLLSMLEQMYVGPEAFLTLLALISWLDNVRKEMESEWDTHGQDELLRVAKSAFEAPYPDKAVGEPRSP